MLPRSLQAWSRCRWPFWLLVGAWLVANSPQAATWAMLDWVEGARSFTHQQRLATEVAVLLGRVKEEAAPGQGLALARGTAEASRNAPATTLPAGVELKKIELGQLAERAEIFAAQAVCSLEMDTRAAPTAPSYEPPTEPPRAA